MASAADFVGAWRLVSQEWRAPDGGLAHPWGASPVGYLLYTPDGYVSAAVMREDHVSAPAPDSGSEEVDALSHVSYCGPYEVRGDRVVHHVRVSSYRSWVGTAQERRYVLADNRLTLISPPRTVARVEYQPVLVWERARP